MKNKCVCCGDVTSHEIHAQKSANTQALANAFSPSASDFGIFYNLLRCTKCGHVFADADHRRILQKYAKADDSGEYFECAEYREKTMGAALIRISRHLPPKGARILDLGAGGGIFLHLARKLGYLGIGIEPSRALCQRAFERYGIRLQQSSLSARNTSDRLFEMVTLWEVIEHFAYPDLEIKKVTKHLKKFGKVLIVTPNIESLSARILGSKWWSYREMHIHYFSPKSLETLMSRIGFSKIYENRFPKTFPLWYYLSKVLLIPQWIKFMCQVPLTLSLGDMIHLYEFNGVKTHGIRKGF